MTLLPSYGNGRVVGGDAPTRFELRGARTGKPGASQLLCGSFAQPRRGCRRGTLPPLIVSPLPPYVNASIEYTLNYEVKGEYGSLRSRSSGTATGTARPSRHQRRWIVLSGRG